MLIPGRISSPGQKSMVLLTERNLIRAWSSREAVHEIQIWSALRDCPNHI